MKLVTLRYAQFDSALQEPKKRNKTSHPLFPFGYMKEKKAQDLFDKKSQDLNEIKRTEAKEYCIPGTWQ